jgi:bacteriocin biosynthesis cyclodehydratase domain-containing protein
VTAPPSGGAVGTSGVALRRDGCPLDGTAVDGAGVDGAAVDGRRRDGVRCGSLPTMAPAPTSQTTTNRTTTGQTPTGQTPTGQTPRPMSWDELTRPVLRPGLRVVRRDDRHLQLGLDPPDRLVLTDRPGLREALTHPAPDPPPHLRAVLDELVRDGWVVDALRRPASAVRSARIAVSADPALEPPVVRACAAAGLTRDDTAAPRLVATLGEPRRAVCDALVRDDVPHLWLAVFPRHVRVGPYVEPGRSACLRCLDAHLGDVDPRRATVLHQLEDLPVAPDGDPDPCLVQIGVAWAVRDLLRCIDGPGASLRSATVTVTADLEATRRDWLRHPHCGCAWDQLRTTTISE